jgi:hypothetical protein
MAFRLFTVPIRNSEAPEAELNSFMQSHTVLDVERRWVDQGSNSFWSFCTANDQSLRVLGAFFYNAKERRAQRRIAWLRALRFSAL